jgi:hypothetical protein
MDWIRMVKTVLRTKAEVRGRCYSWRQWKEVGLIGKNWKANADR